MHFMMKMNSNLEEELFPIETISVLKELQGIIGDFIITGSISLRLHNVIKRKVNDIDLVIENVDFDKINDALNEHNKKKKDEWFCDSISLVLTSVYPHFHNKKHIIIVFQNTKFCVFEGKYNDFIELEVKGFPLKILHPRYSIDAKLNILKHLEKSDRSKNNLIAYEKHLKDIMYYNSKNMKTNLEKSVETLFSATIDELTSCFTEDKIINLDNLISRIKVEIDSNIIKNALSAFKSKTNISDVLFKVFYETSEWEDDGLFVITCNKDLLDDYDSDILLEAWDGLETKYTLVTLDDEGVHDRMTIDKNLIFTI